MTYRIWMKNHHLLNLQKSLRISASSFLDSGPDFYFHFFYFFLKKAKASGLYAYVFMCVLTQWSPTGENNDFVQWQSTDLVLERDITTLLKHAIISSVFVAPPTFVSSLANGHSGGEEHEFRKVSCDVRLENVVRQMDHVVEADKRSILSR